MIHLYDFIILTGELFIRVLPQIVLLLISIAYLTLAERKIMASMQRRRGPNVVGFLGILQPLADGLKLLLKETILPGHANLMLFILAPVFTFICSLFLWSILPFDYYSNLEYGFLYLLAISSLSVYGIIFSGWSSNSKYAFLGGLRSAAQMISYEICIGLVFLGVLVFSGSFKIIDIMESQKYIYNVVPLFPLWVVFIISALAETNRAPFDFPEAEAELVAGYNVEYSAMGFALFFLGEYGNILFMSSTSTILFFGGWGGCTIFSWTLIINYLLFGLKLALHSFIFIWVRASFPRFRYDQLMRIGWKIFLPFCLGFILFEYAIIFIFF